MFVPVTAPARDAIQYGDVRITAVSISQGSAGGQVTAQIQCVRCRTLPDGTVEDAPSTLPKSSFGLSVQYGLSTVQSDQTLSTLLGSLYQAALAEAVKQGHLQAS